MRMDILREFRDLGHSLNFTETAKRLHMTQPKLSKHMSELEQELGFRLFVRERKIRLTPAGKCYLATVAKMVHMHDECVEKCRAMQTQGVEEIRLAKGPFDDEAQRLLILAARAFAETDASTPLRFTSPRTRTGLEAVADDRVDVALATGGGTCKRLRAEAEERNVVVEPLFTCPLVVVASADHELARKESLRTADIAEHVVAMPASQTFNLYRFALLDLFEMLGKAPDYLIHPVESFEDLMLAKGKDELLLLTPSVARSEQVSAFGDFAVIPFADERYELAFHLAYREEDEKRPDFREFIALLRECANGRTDEAGRYREP